MGTSIPVSKEFRDQLKDEKREGESYESYLKRRLPDDEPDGMTESDLQQIETLVDRRLDKHLQSHREELYSNLR